jgi:hypothetical protein
MSALNWVEQVNDVAVLGIVVALMIALAIVCAPPMQTRRMPALAKRMRDSARY